MMDYIKDPDAIYRASFATVRAETDLARFPDAMADLVVRLVHASGMTDIAEDIAYSEGAAESGRRALGAGAAILVDVEMVRAGIIQSALDGNATVCTLNDDGVAADAKAWATTRSAAAVDRWTPHLDGAVVAIGNAPTALFRLLELISDGAPKPAVILGFPVGFIGAAESKQALADNPLGVDFVTLLGRRGGSAMASAAVNALTIGAST